MKDAGGRVTGFSWVCDFDLAEKLCNSTFASLHCDPATAICTQGGRLLADMPKDSSLPELICSNICIEQDEVRLDAPPPDQVALEDGLEELASQKQIDSSLQFICVLLIHESIRTNNYEKAQ